MNFKGSQWLPLFIKSKFVEIAQKYFNELLCLIVLYKIIKYLCTSNFNKIKHEINCY